MDRKERREIDRAVRKLASRGNGGCNICGRAFEHGEHTFTGQSVSRLWRTVGACCKDKLIWIGASGVYAHWDKPFDQVHTQMDLHPARQHFISSAGTEYILASEDVDAAEGDSNVDRER